MVRKQRTAPINEYEISHDSSTNTWLVTGPGLQRFVQMTNWRYKECMLILEMKECMGREASDTSLMYIFTPQNSILGNAWEHWDIIPHKKYVPFFISMWLRSLHTHVQTKEIFILIPILGYLKLLISDATLTIQRLFSTDPLNCLNRYIDSERRFQHVLEACGVNKSLIKLGVKEGDTVIVGDVSIGVSLWLLHCFFSSFQVSATIGSYENFHFDLSEVDR